MSHILRRDVPKKGDIRVRFLLKPVWESSSLSSFSFWYPKHWASIVAQMVKNLPTMHETQIKKTPWRREWKPTPVFLSGELHGQRSLAGYSPWGHKQSDTTERLTHTHTLTPVFLPGESQGQGRLVGCCLWGCTESDTTEAT